MFTKKVLALLLVFLIGFTIFTGVLPGADHVYAARDPAREMNRRKVAVFKECLVKGLDRGDGGGNDTDENWSDLWEHTDNYEKNRAVVGFDRTPNDNGITTCKFAIREGLEVLDARTYSEQEAEYRLENFLLPEGYGKWNDERWRKHLDEVVYPTLNNKINELGPPDTAFLAERLVGLARQCYQIKLLTPSLQSDMDSGKDFIIENGGKKYFFDFTDFDDNSLPYIRQGTGGAVGGVAAAGRYNEIGNIELGFHDKGDGIGVWNSWSSDFYPFGSDVAGETSGYNTRGSGGIVPCEFVKKKASWLGTEAQGRDYVLGIDADTQAIVIDRNGNGTIDPEEGTNPADPSNLDSGDGLEPEAEDEVACDWNANPLSWILCPIMNLLRDAISFFHGFIVDLLYTDLGSTEFASGGEFYQIWSVFRYISLSIIVVAAIAMVVGQATSSFIDAYSIKKILPKLLAAIVMIALSWIGTTMIVDIMNTIGLSIREIMLLPFGGEGKIASKVFSLGGGEFALTGLGIAGAGVAAAGLGIMGALSFAVTGMLAMFVGFAILAFRQVLILLLVVTSPIAIACSILPNTEKVWKMWKDSFIKVLLMFPMIMVLVGAGQIAAFAAAARNDIVGQVIAFIGFFGPYFAIPATFKLAGGAFATLAGAANNRSKGVFDRQRNWRGNISKQRKENAAYENYKNRDAGGLKGFRARQSLNMGAIGAGHSPIALRKDGRAKAAWNRQNAGQAAQALKVQQDAFQQELVSSNLEGLPPTQLNGHLASLAKGQSITFMGADGKQKTVEASAASTKWAMDQIGKKGLIGEARDVQAHYEGAGATDTVNVAYWNSSKQDNYGNIKDKAPDMVGKNLHEVSAESMVSWDSSTWQRWHNDLATDHAAAVAGDMDAAARGVAKEAQLRAFKDDPKLRAKLGSEATGLATGERPDGTVVNPLVKSIYDHL